MRCYPAASCLSGVVGGLQLANSGDEKLDQPGERLLEIMRVRVTVARLQMGESVEGAAEGASHVDALVSDARSVTIGERSAGGQ